MSNGESVIEIIISIMLVVFFFFIILPEMAKITETVNILWIYVLGIILIITLILSLFKR